MNPRLQPVRWTALPTAWKLDMSFVIQGVGCQGSGHQPDVTTEKPLQHSLLWGLHSICKHTCVRLAVIRTAPEHLADDGGEVVGHPALGAALVAAHCVLTPWHSHW
jgi:hypothetical protein